MCCMPIRKVSTHGMVYPQLRGLIALNAAQYDLTLYLFYGSLQAESKIFGDWPS
jgi:hypothetical protein